MNISVITPFYCGNKYMNQYFMMMKAASINFCNDSNRVEVCLVNDSPWVPIEIPTDNYPFELIIINNERNSGIHASRVRGMQESSGDYLLLLDQDDMIDGNFFKTQAGRIGDADIVLGNGIFELEDHNQNIFKNLWSLKKAATISPYIFVRNLIISPGQCLIRKKSIPAYWTQNIMTFNGADDYFLWILLMSEKKKWACNFETVYVHRYTGENLSRSLDDMFVSSNEMLAKLKGSQALNMSMLENLRRTIHYKYNISKGLRVTIRESIKNPFIFLYNVYFRIVWRGCHL